MDQKNVIMAIAAAIFVVLVVVAIFPKCMAYFSFFNTSTLPTPAAKRPVSSDYGNNPPRDAPRPYQRSDATLTPQENQDATVTTQFQGAQVAPASSSTSYAPTTKATFSDLTPEEMRKTAMQRAQSDRDVDFKVNAKSLHDIAEQRFSRPPPDESRRA